MMNTSEIINKYLGKRVDFDGVYGFQCVDWAKQFCKEIGYPIGSFGGSAINGWKTGSPFNNKWIRIQNSPKAIPQEGDIVFLAPTDKNPYGHVAVAGFGSTVNDLVLIEQNAGSGNGDGKGGNVITHRIIGYDSVSRGKCLGWFTLKK